MGIRDSINNILHRNEKPEDPKQFCLERVILFSSNPNQQLLPNGIYEREDPIDLGKLNKGSILRCTYRTKYQPGIDNDFTGYSWFIIYDENLLFNIGQTTHRSIGDENKEFILRRSNNFRLDPIKPYSRQFYVMNMADSFFGKPTQGENRLSTTEYQKIELMESGVASTNRAQQGKEDQRIPKLGRLIPDLGLMLYPL